MIQICIIVTAKMEYAIKSLYIMIQEEVTYHCQVAVKSFGMSLGSTSNSSDSEPRESMSTFPVDAAILSAPYSRLCLFLQQRAELLPW